ncbi:alpha-mannosidase [Companilactobacillus suantsaicola]|uniref:Alpha-mannosidase n=1 Tax=Companilactobacillus suantsaicola TaxID=2487723 RepID=A0A4Z0JLI9_9LACO|nr:glycoside hydrolase family 38 C-terminal domain-containing protein [Companilactobacillus suantsaicola]TGD22896.1 alpha-mannosidase [Companilactobacillus suantsaicola]
MKKVYAIAHTHWDFEWYFTRQEARVQFAYHMDEVFDALEKNVLNYYLLDGQMSIIDDYLNSFPEKRNLIKKFVKEKRLFIGPWYTQIDEMVTSGESIVRNLSIGRKIANDLGGSMDVAYLPDSFGQGSDMPKIYNGFGIYDAVFWRGMPKEKNARYFYWNSNDGSKVLTANIKNGYYAGVQLVESDYFKDLMNKISTDTDVNDLVLPVGGDQRAIDYNLKNRIQLANEKLSDEYIIKESNYPEYFANLRKEKDLPNYSGEFIDPSASKIHRGIYSSRADLKQIYDQLERRMTYQVEPLMALAKSYGIPAKQGLVDDIWKTIFRGQAHDSSGGCNSDKTNDDILHRAKVADQLSYSIVDYLIRKLSISQETPFDVYLWNPLPIDKHQTVTIQVSTRSKGFKILDKNNQEIQYDLINQKLENAAALRRNIEERKQNLYYISTISFMTDIPATGWSGFTVQELKESKSTINSSQDNHIDNKFYNLSFNDGQIDLTSKSINKTYPNFLSFEDGADAGDTYDYSPSFNDWIIHLDFKQASIETFIGQNISSLKISGQWELPANLDDRKNKKLSSKLSYQLTLTLKKDSQTIDYKLETDNQTLDHRLRLVLNPNLKSEFSFADTPFGVIKRPVIDPHLNDWQAIGYHEEPTAMRPFIHLANIHSQNESCTFLGLGSKDFQVIGSDFNKLAITMFRSVGYLGRPDLLRRPSDASGLESKYVETPHSQLQGKHIFEGGIVVSQTFDAAQLQREHLLLSTKPLFFQNQTLNRFTNPLRYFMMNKVQNYKQSDLSLIQLKSDSLVLSSFHLTNDETGSVLRLYNPSDKTINNGSIKLGKSATVTELTLDSHLVTTLETSTDDFKLPSFKPGEIKTFGINFTK